jgi:hypothetical protein
LAHPIRVEGIHRLEASKMEILWHERRKIERDVNLEQHK